MDKNRKSGIVPRWVIVALVVLLGIGMLSFAVIRSSILTFEANPHGAVQMQKGANR